MGLYVIESDQAQTMLRKFIRGADITVTGQCTARRHTEEISSATMVVVKKVLLNSLSDADVTVKGSAAQQQEVLSVKPIRKLI